MLFDLSELACFHLGLESCVLFINTMIEIYLKLTLVEVAEPVPAGQEFLSG